MRIGTTRPRKRPGGFVCGEMAVRAKYLPCARGGVTPLGVTEGLAGCGYEFPVAHYGAVKLQPLSQLTLTAPLTQGSYGAVRDFCVVK